VNVGRSGVDSVGWWLDQWTSQYMW